MLDEFNPLPVFTGSGPRMRHQACAALLTILIR